MQILATTTNFGYGPVSKLSAILKQLLKNDSNQITFIGSGQSLNFIKRTIKSKNLKFLEIDIQSLEKNDFEILVKNYDLILSVLGFELHDLVIEDKDRKYKYVFIDSLNWMWTENLKSIEKSDFYFVQKYGSRSASIDLPINGRLINEIFDGELITNDREIVENRIIFNFAGIILPSGEVDFGEKYIKAYLEIIRDNNFGKQYDIIVAVNEEQYKLLSEHDNEKYNNIKFCVLSHTEFLKYASTSQYVFSTPGLTFRIESIALGINVFYLLPTNYSQALLIEDYIHGGSNGMNLFSYGKEFEIKSGLEEMDGVALTREKTSFLLKKQRNLISKKIVNYLKNDEGNSKSSINSTKSTEFNGVEQIINTLTTEKILIK